MDVVPARNLGVPLCCALETETNTSIAQELGVLNNTMCEIGLNPNFAFFSFSFRLSVPLLSPFESKSTSTAVYQHSQLVNVVENIAEDHNVGVCIVTIVSELLCQFVRYTFIMICRILIHFTPCNKHWPPYVHHLNLFTISCCLLSLRTVFEKCRQLKAIILRNLFRRCDFVVFYKMFCRVKRFTVFFVLASLLFMIMPALGKWSVADVGTNEPCIDNTPSGVHVGGGRIPLFNLDELLPYVDTSGKCLEPVATLKFVGHKHKNVVEALYKNLNDHVYGKVPLNQLLVNTTVKDAKSVANIHGVHVPSKSRVGDVAALFNEHSCDSCETHLSVFSLHVVKSNSKKCKQWYAGLDDSGKKHKLARQHKKETSKSQKQKKAKQRSEKQEALRLSKFPPSPPSEILQETIAQGWCKDTSPDAFMEGGCAVCGQLTPMTHLSKLSKSGCDLDVLI